MEVTCFTGGGGYLEPVRQRLPHLLFVTGKIIIPDGRGVGIRTVSVRRVGKPGGGHRGKIKARSVEYQQPRAVKIIYGGILFAVVANRFHGAAFQGFLTGAQLFVVVRLLLDIGYSFIVIPSKVFRSRFAAKVAVNAGTVHVKFPGDV
jgi:hypothetical protein